MEEKSPEREHEEWLARRPKPTAEKLARALEILNRQTENPPEPGDELPDDYPPRET